MCPKIVVLTPWQGEVPTWSSGQGPAAPCAQLDDSPSLRRRPQAPVARATRAAAISCRPTGQDGAVLLAQRWLGSSQLDGGPA